MWSLIDLYFLKVHIGLTILHERTFRRDVTSGLHLRNHYFGGVLLLVCATASRYSEDSRVVVDGQPAYSSGWMWFEQVEKLRKAMYEPPTLYELQVYCVRDPIRMPERRLNVNIMAADCTLLAGHFIPGAYCTHGRYRDSVLSRAWRA